MTNTIEIKRLVGKFIKAAGIGRIHAMENGTWSGVVNGIEVSLPTENAALVYFSNAIALVAISR